LKHQQDGCITGAGAYCIVQLVVQRIDLKPDRFEVEGAGVRDLPPGFRAID
jgi:hypothetical protein